MACSDEGNASYLFSSRLSSRPLGWSKVGSDKMPRLRIYTANGGNIYELVKYKKEKHEREIKEEILEAIDQRIRKKENITQMYGTNKVYQPVAVKEMDYTTQQKY